jgi:hypothetical protein
MRQGIESGWRSQPVGRNSEAYCAAGQSDRPRCVIAAPSATKAWRLYRVTFSTQRELRLAALRFAARPELAE